ncbi:MAG: TerD family protein [Lachnospiraceae bacterium]|nr:TerD family protein [Lachnospiraceae bacterium]
MSVSLTKGQKVSLTKESSSLSRVIVGLGWDEVEQKKGLLSMFFKKEAIDCDAAAILLKGGKFTSKEDIVYFGNLRHKSLSVIHMGDNLTGQGEGDDEQIVIDLGSVPSDYDKIVISCNIYKAYERRQHFGLIRNAFVRIVDAKTNKELCRYNLSDEYANATAMIFGEIYRHDNEWKFGAVGQGTNDPGLGELVKRFI